MNTDILILDQIGGDYTHASLTAGGLGGSEIEVLQVAHGLTARGYRVVVANGVPREALVEGVRFVPADQAPACAPTRALYLQRWSNDLRIPVGGDVRVVVRANDVYCAPYEVHREKLASGRATLVTNTRWQAALFGFAANTVVIPPMLEPMPSVEKEPGLFVFASGAMKGLEATIEAWRRLKAAHAAMRDARLTLVSPGWGAARPLTDDEGADGIVSVGAPTPDDYRHWIAKAEGLFMVLTMPETFGCVAALAERAGTRTHILCLAGLGGLPEAVRDARYLTEDADQFEASFVAALGQAPATPQDDLPDLCPATAIDRWVKALGLATTHDCGADCFHRSHFSSLSDTQYADRLQAERAHWNRPGETGPAGPTARPTVGVVIIAKGEEIRTLVPGAVESARQAGVDVVTVVCDAGDVVSDLAGDWGPDVFLRPSPAIDWDNGIGVIAGARNAALAIAEARSDYVLMLDADDRLEGQLPAVLDRDAYELTIHDRGSQYRRTQLWRSSLGWRYTGIVHESIAMTAAAIGVLSAVQVVRGYSADTHQNQDSARVKFSKHATLLKTWLKIHPHDARAQFYLARSLHDAGRLDEAVEAYRTRASMVGGWVEEQSYACYAMGTILAAQGRDPTLALLRAHGLGVLKAEPLVALSKWYRDDARREFSTAYAFARRAAEIPRPEGALFVEPGIYQFEAEAEVAVCQFYLGQVAESVERFAEIVRVVPDEHRAWAETQLGVCRAALGQERKRA